MPSTNYPIINTHCHLLNFAFVPDKMFKLLSGVPENLVREHAIQEIAQVIVDLTGARYKHLEELLKIYCDNNIENVAASYIKRMEDAGIKIATPLMMDLEACFQERAIDPDENYVPYAFYPDNGDEYNQIDKISKITARYPWQIFPFIMFDPRRQHAVEICKNALEYKGFLGIKLYPALGYFPVSGAGESQEIDDALKAIYTYCGTQRIPITVHCATRGAYAQHNPNWKDIWKKTDPWQWIETIKTYDLKVNFAHFGGTHIKHPLDRETQLSLEWHKNIQTMMRSIYRLNIIGSKASVFADVSYHELAHDHELQDEYFWDLKGLLNEKHYQTQVLFGTDASMISHTWHETEFLVPFLEHLNEAEQKRLFFENPAKFLFEDGEIPSRYIQFLKAKAAKSLEEHSLPNWIVKNQEKFCLKGLS